MPPGFGILPIRDRAFGSIHGRRPEWLPPDPV